MSKTIELTIRDGIRVLYTAAAKVDDDFEEKLFDAYTAYYPDTPDNEVLFYRFAQGIFEGVNTNIRSVLERRPPKLTPQFSIDGDEVKSLTGDKPNDE
jgi:hypothetical protein